MSEILLDISNLTKRYRIDRHRGIAAVDSVSLQVKRGEILGLVGESGCGKSTLAKLIMNIEAADEGHILYDGIDICDRREYRNNRYALQTERQLIFQDSTSSLDPRMTVRQIVAEPLMISKKRPIRPSISEEVGFQLRDVGITEEHYNSYPYELSGGMRQRIAIARALTMEPKLLVADEPVASLDVSVQAQIINLFKHLQEEHGFTFIFIAHDLSVVRYLCDRVAVMNQGKIVELAETEKLFEAPEHDYTKKLIINSEGSKMGVEI